LRVLRAALLVGRGGGEVVVFGHGGFRNLGWPASLVFR
jgi:hypothetical protein